MTTKNLRPKFLNLFKIHLPITGIASFAHRVSGTVLVLALPLAVFLLARSVQDQASFLYATQFFSAWWGWLLLALLLWAFIYHLLAGLRFLLLDLDLGVSLRSARASAWLVLGGGVLLSALVLLWGWS